MVGILNFVFASVLLVPSPVDRTRNSPGGCSKFMLRLRNPEPRKLQSFKGANWNTCPNFIPEGDVILFIPNNKQVFLCPKEIPSLSFKSVCSSNTLEKTVWNKSCRCLCSEGRRKRERSGRNCFQEVSKAKFMQAVQGFWRVGLINDLEWVKFLSWELAYKGEEYFILALC